MAESGIYEIVNLVNGKRYVGSAVSIPKRWAEHRRDLERGSHHCRPLMRAWLKYGPGAFAFRVIVECAPDDLIRCEQLAFDRLSPEYNCCKKAGSTLGLKHSDEARAKMSTAQRALYADGKPGNNKGRKYSREICERMAAPKRGKKRGPMPDAVKAKLSAAKAGRPNPKLLGRVVSEETRQKIRSAIAGVPHSVDRRKARASLSDEQVAMVLALRLGGMTCADIGRRLSISDKLVGKISRRERYEWVSPDIGPIAYPKKGRGGWKHKPGAMTGRRRGWKHSQQTRAKLAAAARTRSRSVKP